MCSWKNLLRFSVWLMPLILLAAVSGSTASKAKNQENIKLDCRCNCDRCKRAVRSINGRNVIKYRSCFRDRNGNSRCDNGISQGGKCRNDCRIYAEPLKKSDKKKIPTPCANCPCPGNCSKCVLGKK